MSVFAMIVALFAIAMLVHQASITIIEATRNQDIWWMRFAIMATAVTYLTWFIYLRYLP